MTKWDYIKLISKKGAPFGDNGGVLDLLQWCGKLNTASVTLEEARAFWELINGEKSPDTKELET